MRSLRYAIALSTLVLAGCTSATEVDGTVNGEWSGYDLGFSVTADLVQASSRGL